MACEQESFDYIIVGGGLAGSTLASLLSKSRSSPSVLLIEAGADASKHPLTQAPLACFAAHRSDLDWNFETVPQPHLERRSLYQAAGKALGGGTVTNYGSWTRGPRFDYDRWGSLVSDSRWSYDGLLPYFEKIEKDHITAVTVSASSKTRKYPLRERVLKGWTDLGLKDIGDAINDGDPIGVGELVENWRDGKRQIASNVFDLAGVTVLSETLVQKVLLEDDQGKPRATGVLFQDGRQILANKEVILSAGAYRTPQLLLLSGIGPEEELNKIGVPVHLNLPEVGRNFHDHLLIGLAFRLRDPSAGLAMGGAAGPWADPAYQMGLAGDWIVSENVPKASLFGAVQSDGSCQQSKDDNEWLLDPRAAHLETVVIYVPGGQPITNMHVPFDGTHIGAVIGAMLPTSRGKISISSASASDPPVIDPHYNETEVDRIQMRYGIRRMLKLVEDSLSDVVESENPPPPFAPLTARSSDSEIDARVRSEARTFFHAAGSASMGTVVDTELRVHGVDRLRVVDASVLPVTISAHLQVATYAIAAQAADMILQGR